MKIYYQWEKGSYHHQVLLQMIEFIDNNNTDIEIEGIDSFEKCWNKLWNDNLLLLAIENSSAGTIYENLYKFDIIDAKIIWERNLIIEHCLCSTETHIKNITKVYSHFKALPQCYNYLREKWIDEQIIVSDTAWAAMTLSKTQEQWSAAICSKLAGEMYWLNILDEWIQDQKGNTTRFVLIAPWSSHIKYKNNKNKISILFEAKNIPASLYKCLWAFATNDVNITKIESLPCLSNPFSYLFWLDFDWKLDNENVKKALTELEFFTSSIKIIGEY